MKEQKEAPVAENGLVKVSCNVCGHEFVIKNGLLKDDIMEITKEWGYFSSKDLEVHRFKVCECCYDTMISKFKIPVTITRKTEVL